MQHLSPERIAALVDESTTLDERTHLELCARCRADFVAVRRIVVSAAAERDRPIAPLVGWRDLSAALRAEGLLQGTRSSIVAPPPSVDAAVTTPHGVRSITSAPSLAVSPMPARGRGAWVRVAGMAAAAALLVSVGVAGGRLTAGGRPGAPTPELMVVQPGLPTPTVTPVAQFRSPDDARATLQSAEEVYSNALLWLAANDSALAPRQAGASSDVARTYRQRLAVLDAAMASARRALYEAPDDPVMNRYYLATLGAREVTLRRLTTVLPASQQVLEY
jgi:hypothetical protein